MNQISELHGLIEAFSTCLLGKKLVLENETKKLFPIIRCQIFFGNIYMTLKLFHKINTKIRWDSNNLTNIEKSAKNNEN